MLEHVSAVLQFGAQRKPRSRVAPQGAVSFKRRRRRPSPNTDPGRPRVRPEARTDDDGLAHRQYPEHQTRARQPERGAAASDGPLANGGAKPWRGDPTLLSLWAVHGPPKRKNRCRNRLIALRSSPNTIKRQKGNCPPRRPSPAGPLRCNRSGPLLFPPPMQPDQHSYGLPRPRGLPAMRRRRGIAHSPPPHDGCSSGFYRSGPRIYHKPQCVQLTHARKRDE